MKKEILKLIPFVSILCLLAISIVGCSYFSPIIGKWQDIQSKDIIEFTRNGNIIIESDGYITAGKYEIISEGVLQVSFGSFAGDLISAFGMDTWKYTISGDSLIIQAGGTTNTLYKYGSTNSTTTAISNNTDTPFRVGNIILSTNDDLGPNNLSYYVTVLLYTTKLTEPNTIYTVELYKNGIYKATTQLSTSSNIDSHSEIFVDFPCSAEEYLEIESLYGLYGLDIFSVNIIK